MTALLTAAQAARLLDEVIYERLVELVDFDGVWRLEQSLAMELGQLDGLADDAVDELSKGMLDRAFRRLGDDPRRYTNISPFGADCGDAELKSPRRANGRS